MLEIVRAWSANQSLLDFCDPDVLGSLSAWLPLGGPILRFDLSKCSTLSTLPFSTVKLASLLSIESTLSYCSEIRLFFVCHGRPLSCGVTFALEYLRLSFRRIAHCLRVATSPTVTVTAVFNPNLTLSRFDSSIYLYTSALSYLV